MDRWHHASNPLPSWVREVRPHQLAAVDEVMDAFAGGASVVFLDAPTGSGKTLLGELVRRELNDPALYVCSSLTLQDQIAADFPYARVIKGRSNYPVAEPEYAHRTCADCTAPACAYCPSVKVCPYVVAKKAARDADLAVLNTTYALYEMNRGKGHFAGRELVIADECDLLESELMRYVELRLTRRLFAELDVEPPKPGAHYKTIQALLLDRFLPALNRELAKYMNVEATDATVERLQVLTRAHASVRSTVKALTDGNWVRDSNDDGGLVMKPISVAKYGKSLLWSHGKRWLCMSATVISPDQMADDLGLELPWEVVTVPMTFPVANRPIIASPVADMSRKGGIEDEDALIDALEAIRALHPDERILVHTVSYNLTKLVVAGLKLRGVATFSYSNTRERAKALRDYRKSRAGMLCAPSLDRGVDFSGDECRVIVVCKVPFPYLGDPQVNGRLHSAGGERWYAAQTVRTLVQMTGRGVRSADDHATSYIIDRNFLRVLREHKAMFPSWWRDALNTAFSPRHFRPAPERKSP